MLSRLTEYATLAVVGAFIFSYLNLYSFYELHFDIDIATYYQASEVIFSNASLFFLMAWGAFFFLAYYAVNLHRGTPPKMAASGFAGFFYLSTVCGCSTGYFLAHSVELTRL
jgi:hypothetical protein